MNYKQISKITIFSLVMAVFAVIGITTFAIDLPNWAKYGSDALVDSNPFDPSKLIPIHVEEARTLSLLCLVVSLLMTAFILWEIKKMEKTNYKNYFVASLGIFTWLMLPYTLYIGFKNKMYSAYLSYLSTNREGEPQISLNSLKIGFKRGGERKKLFFNTLFAYFVFGSTLVGFVFTMITAEALFGLKVINPFPGEGSGWLTEQQYYNYYNGTPFLLNSFVFFTQLGNFSCFLFMATFVLFHNKIIFRGNTIMNATTGYIFVVMSIFWGYLFPKSLANNAYVKDFQWAKTIWLHAVTPLLFIFFYITSILVTKEEPMKFKKIIWPSIIFPISYGLLIYPLPFFTRFSVYGGLTNLNANMDMSIGIQKESLGNPIMILGIIGLGALFIFVIFCLWSFAYLVHKRSKK
ncbi:MAG: DUF1600 domain-containing protein [Mycoplasmataceae bacterium]|nr:DUF1600 domain-containing protein [Mycoplasmataceae bacterium]